MNSKIGFMCVAVSAGAACLGTAASSSAGVTYLSATRRVEAATTSPVVFSSTDLGVFSHQVATSGGFFPPCSASLNSSLLADRIDASGRVSASGGRASGVDLLGSAVASQTVVVEFSQTTDVWFEGGWTLVQGFGTGINEIARIRPAGGGSYQSLPGAASPLRLAAGSYQLETSVSSSAGPSIITATANFASVVRFLEVVPPCPADFNGSGSVSVQDIFDFLAAYFNNEPAADFNGTGGISVQDIFDFLTAYFAGCV